MDSPSSYKHTDSTTILRQLLCVRKLKISWKSPVLWVNMQTRLVETSREIQDTLPQEYLSQPHNQEDSPRGEKKLVCMSSTPTFLRRLPKGLAFVLPSLALWWVQHSWATWGYWRWWHGLIDAIDPPHCSTWNKLMKNLSSRLLLWESKGWSMYPAP